MKVACACHDTHVAQVMKVRQSSPQVTKTIKCHGSGTPCFFLYCSSCVRPNTTFSDLSSFIKNVTEKINFGQMILGFCVCFVLFCFFVCSVKIQLSFVMKCKSYYLTALTELPSAVNPLLMHALSSDNFANNNTGYRYFKEMYRNEQPIVFRESEK